MKWIVVVLGMGMLGEVLLGDVFLLESRAEFPQLIELYTSEGCSSCPPAEKWLSEFLDDPDLWEKKVPVAFHVDYWDRLGWRDKYATRENTLRQYQLRDEGAVKSIYTPGFVVNGREWRGWFEGETIDGLSSQVGIEKLVVEIDSGQLKATYPSDEDGLLLNVAVLGIDLESKVSRGENRGRLLKHNFVALDHWELLLVGGKAEITLSSIERGIASRFGIAVWIVSASETKPEVVVGNWLPSEVLVQK